MLATMVGTDTLQARPSAFFDPIKTYGTPLSSHASGKCKTISMGSASAAMITSSAFPLFTCFNASLAPRFIACKLAPCFTKFKSSSDSSSLANGMALGSICISF
eukprot:XP_001706106.1 Hypothetical protein GL50803_31643 [Giardia lamblia ATCC 50803]